MMRIQSAGMIALLMILFMILSQPIFVRAEDSGLVDILAGQLGISQGQAEGGAGAVFKLAKQYLSDQDYGSLTNKIPGIEKMIGSAPEPEKKSDLFSSVSSILGSNSGKLDKMVDLQSSFQKLGMSGDMVGKFMPIIYSYVKDKGGETLMNSLKNALL
jgi:hypothetical protein